MITITVSSFKGGTAKTSSCLHIGASLSLHHDYRVLLIDYDAQANLTSGLGYDVDEHDSIAPVLQGKRSIDEVILKTKIPHLEMIPSDIWLERIEVTDSLATDRYSHERLKKVLEPLSDRYDFIIIDTPPSLCWLTESALIASDQCLVCATPEFYSIKGLQRLASFIENIGRRHPIDVTGVCMSLWNPRGKNNDTFLHVIEEHFPSKAFKTKIRRDISITEASILGSPVYNTQPRSRAGGDYQELTREILKRLKKRCKHRGKKHD